MNPTTPDRLPAPSSQPAPAGDRKRKPYRTPLLRKFGTLRTRTTGGSPGPGESGLAGIERLRL